MSGVRYGISSELGELETWVHHLEGRGGIYNSGREFFEATSPLENFKSTRYLELALEFSVDSSVRRSTEHLNRIRNEGNGVRATTYRNTIEREGQRIQASMEEKCEKILKENGFTEDGDDIEWNKINQVEAKYIDAKVVAETAASLNISKYEISDYELQETTVNISIDEVSVKRQSEMRPKNEKKEQRNRIDNTIIHLENDRGKYILNGNNIKGTLKLLIGFLVGNGLMWQQIVVFADGARKIHDAVHEMLGYAKVKIILDWYHLDKKCREYLSMGVKGVKIRNEILSELLPKLWYGDVEGAIELLRGIDESKLKEPKKVMELVDYFERVREYVPCYALRDRLGLRNSSNRGEKANDLVVSKRQKHNGMAWSDDGSTAFASVAAASFNGELLNWLHRRDISFNLLHFSA